MFGILQYQVENTSLNFDNDIIERTIINLEHNRHG